MKPINCPRCGAKLGRPLTRGAAGPFREAVSTDVRRCEPCALTILQGEGLSAEIGRGALPVARFRVARRVAEGAVCCPLCSRFLRSVTFDEAGEMVTVEECGTCRLFVLDDGELDPLKRFLTRAQAETGRAGGLRSLSTDPAADRALLCAEGVGVWTLDALLTELWFMLFGFGGR